MPTNSDSWELPKSAVFPPQRHEEKLRADGSLIFAEPEPAKLRADGSLIFAEPDSDDAPTLLVHTSKSSSSSFILPAPMTAELASGGDSPISSYPPAPMNAAPEVPATRPSSLASEPPERPITNRPPSSADALLWSAARSMALRGGRIQTMADVVHARALRYYAPGILQYLAIRLGTVNAAERTIRKVRVVAAAHATDEFVAPPGVRARLYRIAREVVRDVPLQVTMQDAPPMPWRKPHSATMAGKVQALRDSLSGAERELLELAHARELKVDEIAFVLEQEESAIRQALDSARSRARALTQVTDGMKLDALLIEAFALEDDSIRGGFLSEADKAALAPGQLVSQRYRVLTRVGSGAFGDVYRAEDVEVPGHIVALKLLHQPSFSEEAKQAAMRELRHIASVFHPSIVSLKDHGWYEERLWFVMPWYEGETLEARLRRGPLSRQEAQTIFVPLAQALATVHELGIRHQDVKPENILLARLPGSGGGNILPILIDLGVAASEAEMLVAGTPTYFAPEVAAQFSTTATDRPRVTAKADVFSLALSLRNALEPTTVEDVAPGATEHFITERAAIIPEPPKARQLRFLRSHFARWMHVKPSERPTAAEFAAELAVLTAPEERTKRRWTLVRAAGPWVALLASIAALGFFWMRERAEAAETAAAAQIREAQIDLQETESERARIAEETVTIRSQLQSEQLGRSELETRLAAASASMQHLNGIRARLRAELADLEVEHSASLTNRDEQLRRYRMRDEVLTVAIAEERARQEQLRRELDAIRTQVTDLDNSLRAERMARSEAETRATRLEQMIGVTPQLDRRPALSAGRPETPTPEPAAPAAATTSAAEPSATGANLPRVEAVAPGWEVP